MLDAMFEMGSFHETGQGVTVMPWSEVAAFVSISGTLKVGWEALTLHKMAKGYFKGFQEGMNPLSIAPMERKSNEGILL